MILDLARVMVAVVLVGVLPGWYWSKVLCGVVGWTERLVYSTALSMALVPAVALVPASLLGFGVTLPVTIVSAALVAGVGLLAYLRFGGVEKAPLPLVPHQVVPLAPPALFLVIPAFGLALGVVAGVVPLGDTMLVMALLAAFAGVTHVVATRSDGRGEGPEVADVAVAPSGIWRLALPAVLILTLARGYVGPVLRDWPFIRGVDHYSHAVMANLMMSRGEIEPYLIYPPGFHTMTALFSTISGIRPLDIFPVLAPAFLLLPPLALYVLARRIWGWQVGLAAAFLSGLVLKGSYWYFADSMYPNFVTAGFLFVLTIAALIGVLVAPGVRSGLLLAFLASSVVLYHQVASMYLALLFLPVAALVLPYLLLRDRRRGIVLFLSLALFFVLSALYVWDTYDLGQAVLGLLGGSGESGTGTAVGTAIGTQPPYGAESLVWWVVTQPVAWLGLMGASLAAAALFRSGTGATRRLALLLPLVWLAFVLIGSFTDLSAFPRRFARDLGVPLSLFGGLALVSVLLSLRQARPVVTYAASLAVLLVGTLAGTQAWTNLEEVAGPSKRQDGEPGLTTTPEIAEAGEWLRRHNEGGNIIVSPSANQVPSRMMLAMGEYGAMQSFTPFTIEKNRDLPPGGAQPLWEVLWVLNKPSSERAAELLEKHDVSYIVTYKSLPDRKVTQFWQLFKARPDLYRTAYENDEVAIFTRREGA